MARVIGKCVTCKKVYAFDGETYSDGPWAGQPINPPLRWCDCRTAEGHPHTAIKYGQVKATYKAERKCDERCTHAKGTACTCSCGGANHAREFLIDLMAGAA